MGRDSYSGSFFFCRETTTHLQHFGLKVNRCGFFRGPEERPAENCFQEFGPGSPSFAFSLPRPVARPFHLLDLMILRSLDQNLHVKLKARRSLCTFSLIKCLRKPCMELSFMVPVSEAEAWSPTPMACDIARSWARAFSERPIRSVEAAVSKTSRRLYLPILVRLVLWRQELVISSWSGWGFWDSFSEGVGFFPASVTRPRPLAVRLIGFGMTWPPDLDTRLDVHPTHDLVLRRSGNLVLGPLGSRVCVANRSKAEIMETLCLIAWLSAADRASPSGLSLRYALTALG